MSDDLLRFAVEGARLGTWRWNLVDNTAQYSERSAQLFGLAPGQALDRALSFRMIHADDRAAVASAVEQAIARHGDCELEFRVVWPDGSIHWLVSRGHAGYDTDGQALCMDGVMWDIDARKHAEQQHQRLQAQFLRAQKMEAIGQLAGGIAHDFNNILTGILGYAKLALANKQLDADSKVRSYVQEVVAGAERAAELVQKMQIFSRGPRSIDGEAAHTTRAVVEEIVKLLRAALPVTLDITQDLEDTPELPIPPADMHQVLINLAINARDAIREVRDVGHLSVSLRAPRVLEAGCSDCGENLAGTFVELAVRDDGCGMPAARVPLIFEPFYTTKEVGKGTGLGMSVVHGIMHDLGGHIVVETGVDTGTVIRLLFPA
ncbi:MAG: PAS domain-containing protein [Gammaproteobacteria bacterium]|nr:PAS domain-containing protein [Gammaproteobacteria bacterium]